MTTRESRELNARLERLEAAAGFALICPHQSSDEFHRALIGDYLRGHAPKQLAGFIAGLVVFAALRILC